MIRLAAPLLLLGILAQPLLASPPVVIKRFGVGTGNNSFGVFQPPSQVQEGRGNYEPVSYGPPAMCFDHEGNLYIYDFFNKRIQVYDAGFRFKETIRLPPNVGGTAQLRITIEVIGNLILLCDFGEALWLFSRDGRLTREFYIFDYSGSDLFYEPQKDLLFLIGSRDNVSLVHGLATGQTTAYKGTNASIHFARENFNSELEVTREGVRLSGRLILAFPQIMWRFSGRDRDGNFYWSGRRGSWMTVLNAEGQQLIQLQDLRIERQTWGGTLDPAVHPHGDVYFLNRTGNGFELVRHRRTW